MKGVLSYEWNPGSVPSPHYFEVRIVVESDGSATLECQPDYDFNEPPVWAWTVDVAGSTMGELDSKVSDALPWPESETPAGGLNVGGVVESITLKRAGRTLQLHASPELVTAIRSMGLHKAPWLDVTVLEPLNPLGWAGDLLDRCAAGSVLPSTLAQWVPSARRCAEAAENLCAAIEATARV